MSCFTSNSNFFLHTTGASSTGKTAATFGSPDGSSPGLFTLTASEIFSLITIANAENPGMSHVVTLSMLTTEATPETENNNTDINDLLLSLDDIVSGENKVVKVRENVQKGEFFAENLTEVCCGSIQEFNDVFNYAMGAEKPYAKYHTLATIKVYENGGETVTKFGFLDLAGKDRDAQAGAKVKGRKSNNPVSGNKEVSRSEAK